MKKFQVTKEDVMAVYRIELNSDNLNNVSVINLERMGKISFILNK